MTILTMQGLSHGAKESSEKSVDRLCRLARFPSAPCRISGRAAQSRPSPQRRGGGCERWMPTSMAKGCRCRRASPLITIAGAVPSSRSICIRAISGHAGLPLPCAAGPRCGAHRRVSRPSAPPRRTDYPCADNFAQRGVDDVNGLKAAWRLVFPLFAGNVPNADEHGIEGTRWTEFVTRVDRRT